MILGISNNLLKEGNGIDTFEAGRNAIDGEGVAAEVGEVETDGCEAWEYLLKDDALGRREADRLREEQFLTLSFEL